MISQERFDELQELFWSETNEEWTQEWRDELTAEESEIIDKWDNKVAKGMYQLASRIVELEAARNQANNRQNSENISEVDYGRKKD